MTGSLQIKNGKYYAVINFKDENGKRKQKWLSTELEVKGNKRRADSFLQKALAEFENPSEIQTNILFCDYIRSWLDKRKNKLELSTWQGYDNIISKHIYPYFAAKKTELSEITARDISGYYSVKLEQGLSPGTIKKHHANIRKCLQNAVIEDVISVNYADKVQLPKIRTYSACFYTSEQLKILLDKAKGCDIEAVIILCVYYGLRRSEALGLKWNAVSFTDNTVRIYNTVTQMYSICEKERTKNASSNRTLPLIPAVREYFLRLRKEQEENKKLFGNCYADNGYICAKNDGTSFTPNTVSHKFTDFLNKNALPHIRLHDLRHSCASLLIAQGVDIKVIQEWLGHSSIATTGNIYGHLQFKQKIATGMVLSNMLDDAAEKKR